MIALLCMSILMGDELPESNRMQTGHLPTPYSAADLSGAITDGTEMEFLVFAESEEPDHVTMRFHEPSETGVRVETTIVRADGSEVVPPAQVSQWTELQSHASFEQSRATVSRDAIETELGRLDCWKYVVQGGDGSGDRLQTYWFADDLPGPPVLMLQQVGGTTVMRMEMVALSK